MKAEGHFFFQVDNPITQQHGHKSSHHRGISIPCQSSALFVEAKRMIHLSIDPRE